MGGQGVSWGDGVPPTPDGTGPGSPPAPGWTRKGKFPIARSPHLLLWCFRLPVRHPIYSHACRYRSFHTLPSGKWFLVRTGELHVVGLKFMGSGPDRRGSNPALPLTTSPLCASASSSGKWGGASCLACRGLGRLRELVGPEHSAWNVTYGGIIIDEY